MVATVMRPPGEDKRPLVIINHGSPADGSQRPKMERPRYPSLSSWFVSRGYVLLHCATVVSGSTDRRRPTR